MSDVRALTEGWEQKHGTPESFEWLVRRLEAAGHPPQWTQDEPTDENDGRGMVAWIKRHFDTG